MRLIRAGVSIGLVVAVVAFYSGCGGDDGSSSSTSTTGEQTTGAGGHAGGGAQNGSPGATGKNESRGAGQGAQGGTAPEGVAFTAPQVGSRVASTFTARVKLQNFEIDAGAVGKANEPGKGHLHFVLDAGKYDEPRYSGENGKLGVAGEYSLAVKPTITYSAIPRGPHTLEVYLANNDHSDAGPRARTRFVVR
jgi:hypothetical protein